ncbi:helix-turn-helix transcriptional regulator [Kushneria marisflavi]|uniref:DNA-binding protein n=1 Tax=Kushneria marisflavi TaxID=157779 RepID=A0A240UQN3_9GAMM|nr:PAS domain-containing protein [Kushneria marisflavi]ART63339.1 DNA-binding protein [Kushneria marisflavi]RKD84380.1 putative transcriptional regulator YheO [Kushneria marisflavi]
MTSKTPEQQWLLEQLQQVADGVAQTFAPFCEVVVHDLLTPSHAVLAIHNNLSGREPGHPATELGLARIQDAELDPVIANYPNRFSDGRQLKSTSIGIKDREGRYIAALCMNIDLSVFQGFQGMLNQFVALQGDAPTQETLDPMGGDAIRARIDRFAASLATTPRALKAEDRRVLVRALKAEGLLEVRRAMEIVAAHLGVSRASVYGYAR